MAHKSKTQRAKASEKRAAKKEAKLNGELISDQEVAVAEAKPAEKKSFFSKKDDKAASSNKIEKKTEKAPKKQRFQFIREVRSEMKRVTWPTRQDVLRWSVVVIVALLFFGIYTAVLDNAVMTPLLVAISGLGA